MPAVRWDGERVMLVTVALVFAVLTPFVLVALFMVALGFTAKWSDEREEHHASDKLECKYALPPCEGRHTRDGVR